MQSKYIGNIFCQLFSKVCQILKYLQYMYIKTFSSITVVQHYSQSLQSCADSELFKKMINSTISGTLKSKVQNLGENM